MFPFPLLMDTFDALGTGNPSINPAAVNASGAVNSMANSQMSLASTDWSSSMQGVTSLLTNGVWIILVVFFVYSAYRMYKPKRQKQDAYYRRGGR